MDLFALVYASKKNTSKSKNPLCRSELGHWHTLKTTECQSGTTYELTMPDSCLFDTRRGYRSLRKTSLYRFEIGQGDFRRDVLEDDFDRHIAFDVFIPAIDYAAHHTDALVKLDDGNIIGHIPGKGGVARAGANGKGINLAFAAHLHPLHVVGKTVGAHGARVEIELAAVFAALDDKLVLFRAVKEGLIFRVHKG